MTTKQDLSSLLFYPFQQGALENLLAESKILFFGGVPTSFVGDYKNIDVLQGFKPDEKLWQGLGYNLLLRLEGSQKYDAVFCVLPQQKDATYFVLAQAIAHLKPQGLLVAVAANDAGGRQIESNMQLFGLVPHALSKSKCRIVWAKNENVNTVKIHECIEGGKPKKMVIGGHEFTTQAGIYGWNKIDKGSQLLADNIPDGLKGVGADYGCGYGFLSFEVLNKNQNIETLHLFDADFNALQCARENLKLFPQAQFDWVDLSEPSSIKNLDWIIMNPPFHDGKKADSHIGQKFIESAYSSLRNKGYLYMVANAHLPYEKTLKNLFSDVDKVIEQSGYKIYFAQK